jgi:hypothetical protein
MMVMEYLYLRNIRLQKEVYPKFLRDSKLKKINQESEFSKVKGGIMQG